MCFRNMPFTYLVSAQYGALWRKFTLPVEKCAGCFSKGSVHSRDVGGSGQMEPLSQQGGQVRSGAALQVQAGAGQEQQQPSRHTHLTYTGYTVQWCCSPGPCRCGTGAATVLPAHTLHLYRIHSTMVLLSRSRQVRDRSSNSPPGTNTSPIQDTQ